MRISRISTLALIAAAAVGAGACGDDEPATSRAASSAKPRPAQEQPSSVVELVALPSGSNPYRFDKKKLTAKAGLVEFRLDNQDPSNTHNIRIQTGKKCCDPARDIGGTESIDGPDQITGRVKLEPGTYWFICGLIGHYDGDMGKMKGKLVVQ